MNPNQISPEQLNNIINIASKQLGKDPKDIKESLDSNKAENLIGSLPPMQKAMVGKMLSNPEALQKMMASPQAKEFLGKLMGGKS